jgi:RNA polymerase sigma factor (sigma-70 family)
MPDSAEPDEVLIARYARGDAAAFERLYERHEQRTWRYLERHVGHRASAEELMQDVWFAVAREAGRYRPSAKFTTWLFTIAHNRVIDWLRTNRSPLSLEAIGYEAGAVITQLTADARAGPSAAAEADEQADALARALGQLPQDQRDAFLMQMEGDLALEEIAAVTGASFETTKSRLRYARVKLRELLKEYA